MRTGADARAGASLTLRFEGRSIPARPGETVAAALVAAGITAFRRTASGQERGLFCGMGVCQDCLVEIDGRPNQRACMSVVTGPAEVRRQATPCPPRPRGASSAPIGLADIPVETPDVLVVGAGAGGLAAAAAAAEAGVGVVLVDERPEPGGQYFKQPAGLGPGQAPHPDDRQFAQGRRAIERARRAGVEIRSGTQVWGAFAPADIAVIGPGGPVILKPRRVIVATGAYERAWPVPGWTLPGVITTGAAQTLLRSHRVAPGRRVLVAGNGPLNLQVAWELARVGAEVAAVVEAAPRPGATAAAAAWAMARSDPGLLAEGLRLRAALAPRRIPVLHGAAVAAVAPHEVGLRVRVEALGAGGPAPRMFDVDALCLGYGFLPQNEILRALGCRHAYDSGRGQLATVRGPDGETSVAAVLAVGDCCGLGGARAAQEEGLIAGVAAARALGRTPSAALAREVEAARARLARHRAFQAGLWRLFQAQGPALPFATPDTIVCRCEEVTLAQVEAAAGEDRPGLGEVKRLTRLGMGRCQGRYCGPVVARLLAERQGRKLDEHAFFAPQAPIGPVTIEDLLARAAR